LRNSHILTATDLNSSQPDPDKYPLAWNTAARTDLKPCLQQGSLNYTARKPNPFRDAILSGPRTEPSPESLQYGGFTFVQEGLTLKILIKISLIYSVSHFNLGGLGALFGGWLCGLPSRPFHPATKTFCQ